MHPGFNERAAMHRYQELVDQGMREQFVASAFPPAANIPAVVAVLQQRLGTLRVWAVQHLQGVQAVTRECCRSVVPGEQGAIASSDDPMCCLIPRYLL